MGRGKGADPGVPRPQSGSVLRGDTSTSIRGHGEGKTGAGPAWGWEEAGGGVPKAEASVVRETGTVGFGERG